MAVATADRAMTPNWSVEIKAEIAPLPSYGYRRAWTMVNRRRDGDGRRRVNHKRVYRVMREHHLLLRRHTGRPIDTRSHDGRIAVAESDRRWCSDGFEIACDNRERVRIAFALDCCDREAMSWVATTGGITGEMVRDLMVEAVEARFGTAPPSAADRMADRQRFAVHCARHAVVCPRDRPGAADDGDCESAVQRHGGSLREDLQARLRRSYGPPRRAHRAAPT